MGWFWFERYLKFSHGLVKEPKVVQVGVGPSTKILKILWIITVNFWWHGNWDIVNWILFVGPICILK
jgi:hypothetical protein